MEDLQDVIYRASRIGSYHESEKGENQDYICTSRDGANIVISLADGVSSCSEAKAGAEVAGEVITRLMIKRGGRIMEYDSDRIAEITVAHIKGELDRRARMDNRSVTDYSSTVASVLYDGKNDRLLCFNLGDSIIISFSGNEYQIVAIPFDSKNGCCVTSTMNAALAATARILDARDIDSVIICSDGAWRHMLSGDRLKTEVRRMLIEMEFDELISYLDSQGCTDDYSFVAMDISEGTRRPA